VGDIDEIEALVYGYAERIDAGDMDGVVDLFAHATWRSGATGETLPDAAAVRAVYDRIALYDDGTPRTKHLITNLVLDIDGTTATGRCSFSVLQGVVPGEPLRFVVAGRYVDRFERGPDGWRFADRLFVAQLSGDQSAHFPQE
jgi:3-phenylpropionate/cinnamic acid dioxygenase small subunit